MRPKAKVSFADDKNNADEKDSISVTQEAIKKMRQSLSNILCFRAIDSRGNETRPRATRTQEIHDLIGSKVCLKLNAHKSKSRRRSKLGSQICLNVNKPRRNQHFHARDELSDFVSISTSTEDTQISSSTASTGTTVIKRQCGYNHDLRPARTYCDIYRNSLVKLRSGFSQLSQKRPEQAQSSRDITANYMNVQEKVPDRDASNLNLKRSVHIYEFTDEQVQKIRKKGCIKLNVKVKPDVCINDIDLIIDKNQVVAIASTSSANANEEK